MKKYLVSMFVYTLLTLPTFLGTTALADMTKRHLPEGAFARLGKGSINDIAYSPDGKYLVVASDIDVWIYDAQTGIEQALIPAAQGNAIRHIAVSPNGYTLAVIGYMREIQLWDYKTQTLKGSLTERGYYPSEIVFSPDGYTLASTDTIQRTVIWDVMTMKIKCTLVGSYDTQNNEGMEYFSVAYSPDGKIIATAAEDGTVLLWNLTSHVLNTK